MGQTETNTDTTTKFNVAGSSGKSFTEGVKVRNQERNDTLLKRHEQKAPIADHYIPQVTSTKPIDKGHDKYQHVVTYFNKTIIKHPYLSTDDFALAFNQSQRNM